MDVLWNFLRMGGRSRTASTALWLVDGSVPSRGRRAWARPSMAGIGLPFSPERPERRESSSASPAASACPGADGGAAGSGLSGVFRRLRFPMRRRADGGPASAANPGNATGRREPGRLRARPQAWFSLDGNRVETSAGSAPTDTMMLRAEVRF